ncbi:MAG: transcription antitermination factor NusB [Flavipsychrobacter sp.]|nr:transcription antitermination factor NusB [Flavipsychrobacter sp.]
MISRRNIRVKVMQTLYTLSSLETGTQVNKVAAAKILDDKLKQVMDLFTASVLYTIHIAQYADTDARMRASKYLTTADDLNADSRIAHNSFIAMLNGNASFAARVKNENIARLIDETYVKKVFQQLQKTTEYEQYVATPQHTPVADKAIMQFIWEKLVVENEDMQSHFTDDLPGWEDDSELIVMLMQNFFRGNSKVDFQKLLSGEKREYAHDLLRAVLDREEVCLELISPKLVNWDKERVAMIDMLLLRMGVCEFLYFPTIPTKVTINEYIDIAKQYSTPQSGQFVNGVLDNILKDLLKEDKIVKTDRPKN